MAQWLHRYSVGSRLVLVQSLCTDRMKIHHQHFGFHMFLVVSMMSIARRHKHTHHTHIERPKTASTILISPAVVRRIRIAWLGLRRKLNGVRLSSLASKHNNFGFVTCSLGRAFRQLARMPVVSIPTPFHIAPTTSLRAPPTPWSNVYSPLQSFSSGFIL